MDNPKMIYKRYIPLSSLKCYINDLYYWSGPAPYQRQKVLPVPSLNVMINLGYPFEVYEPDRTDPLLTCADSWSVGVWDTYHLVDWPQNVEFFGIHFKPAGAYPFLQFHLSELNSQIIPLDLIWGQYAREIRERLYAAPTIQAGFDLLEKLLLARFSKPPRGLDLAQYAIAEIAKYHGTVSVRDLSDSIGVSQNHLNTQLKRFVGIPPKELTRLYRFAHVLHAIDTARTINWTSIALQSGFYDQSHFNKDFAAFTGHSPTDYLRQRCRILTENPEQAQICHNLPID